MHLVILLLAAIGHAILWVALVNRAHALGVRRRWVDLMTLLCVIMFAVMPVVVLAALLSVIGSRPTPLTSLLYAAACIYIIACAAVCVVATVQRLYWRFHPERRNALVSNHTTRINVADHVADRLIAPGVATWLSRLPGNEVRSVWVQEKELNIPRLTPEHAGLRLVHLTDLHMSGRITKAYYQYVVDEVNRCQPDIVAITGDLVDRESCLAWIPDTLGRLRAAGGVFYVLGNHDRRITHERLTAALADAGHIHLGGRVRLETIGNCRLALAGNEMPWFGPAGDLAGIPRHDSRGLPLRVALAHSPDQIGWACANDVDLLLAGHVHGGQICLPILGALTAPSMHGVRYAAGTFRVGNMVMHVSRGTSNLTPVRWNCPPEIAVLTLQAGKQ